MGKREDPRAKMAAQSEEREQREKEEKLRAEQAARRCAREEPGAIWKAVK
jgi:hypothetical protein